MSQQHDASASSGIVALDAAQWAEADEKAEAGCRGRMQKQDTETEKEWAAEAGCRWTTYICT